MLISRRYPYLPFRCQVGEWSFDDWAYVDTGFDGGLIVPESEAPMLGIPLKPTLVELGDGSLILALEYEGLIRLGEAEMPVMVLCLGTEYVLGREVIDELRICFHHGQRVEVEL
jgi:predicted aspartyl protease